MKLKVPNIYVLSLTIVLFYVNCVRAQFAKGVVRNNVFYVNETSSESTDNLNVNKGATNNGYFRTKLKPTMVSELV